MASIFGYGNKHAVAGSTRLASTTATGGDGIVDIRLTADRDNGVIVGKGAFEAGQVYAEAAATTFTGKIIDKASNGNWYVEVATATNAYIVIQVPLIYEQGTSKMQHESNFYNLQGDVVRAYKLVVGDVFEISAEGISGTPTKGANVTVDATTKKVKVS